MNVNHYLINWWIRFSGEEFSESLGGLELVLDIATVKSLNHLGRDKAVGSGQDPGGVRLHPRARDGVILNPALATNIAPLEELLLPLLFAELYSLLLPPSAHLLRVQARILVTCVLVRGRMRHDQYARVSTLYLKHYENEADDG